MNGKLTTVVGDVLNPQTTSKNEVVVIPHICNNIFWGAGFVSALSKKWKLPEKRHLENVQRYGKIVPLGTIQRVKVAPNTFIVNMTAQDNAGILKHTKIPLVYSALVHCMEAVEHLVFGLYVYHANSNIVIHCPRFGSGIAGGDQKVIEQLMVELWANKGIDVVVYDLPPKPTQLQADLEDLKSDPDVGKWLQNLGWFNEKHKPVGVSRETANDTGYHLPPRDNY